MWRPALAVAACLGLGVALAYLFAVWLLRTISLGVL